MKFKYAVFDMDGTLLDTMKYWHNIFPIYAEMNGLKDPGLSEELLNKVEAMEPYEGIEYLKKHSNSEAVQHIDAADVLNIMEDCYLHRTSVREGVLRMLETLKANNVKMCCVSATPSNLVHLALKTAGIREYFEFILTPDDYPKGKSSPEIFCAAAERFGCDITELVLFEDALYSMKTAKKIGMRVVAVRERYEEQNLDKIKQTADEVYNEFTEFKFE